MNDSDAVMIIDSAKDNVVVCFPSCENVKRNARERVLRRQLALELGQKLLRFVA